YRRYGMEKEYANVSENRVEYNGPAVADAPRGPLRIALFAPGAGETAARLASLLEPYKGRYELVPVASDLPWGKASNQLVKLLYQDGAIGMISTGREAAHLAEQLAIKAFVPLIAVSADRSLTAVNIPWIFRLPADTAPEDALRTLLEAAEKSGPNRARLRAVLASGTTMAGRVRFDSRGEPQ
ncbi:MAG TPA: hypothetical protein VHA11_11860, partial [Bryobacteraceae bacterium]|nr:hypothetical protein [Bryobacteraceae bacterium]